MRPQDIVVLLKIVALKNKEWNNSLLAHSLQISPSEISEALNRCLIAGLIDSKKKDVNLLSLKEFLLYGLKYVFPSVPGAIVKGIPTAHSAKPLSDLIAMTDEVYVWPYYKGTHRGQAIEPLYKTVPQIAREDVYFYELLTIIDALRVGRARENKFAREQLEIRLNHE